MDMLHNLLFATYVRMRRVGRENLTWTPVLARNEV